MSSAARSSRPLGEVLATRRRNRFVGRAAEVELVRATLESDDPPFSVLHVHGPGGIGKSSLLDVIDDAATLAGATVVRLDGRTLPPAPCSVLDALAEALDVPDAPGAITGNDGRVVLLFDTYERLAGLDEWLRTDLLPRLPSTALTVIAARTPPDPGWRADPAWGELLRVISLRNLSPAESREYLRRTEVDPARHEQIVRVAHGHPLGLALLVDVVVRGGEVADHPLTADLVAILLKRFVEIVPSELHRRALEVFALARVTTEDLLRAALAVPDAHELFSWLRGLSFGYPSDEGLYPHDLARDVLDADLRWRDGDGYRKVFHRVWTHIRGQLRSTTGRRQQRGIFDLKFVFRNLSGVLSPVDWESWGGRYPEPARPADRETILDLVAAAEGDESAAIAAFWLDRQPDGFFVLREPDGSVRGLLGLLDLTRASPGERAADPGARAAWEFAQRQSPARTGEVLTQTRFIIDRECYQDPSPSMNATPVLTMQRYLCMPRLSWDFVTLAEPDRWNDYFAAAGLPRASDADFELGGRRYGLFAHDFRQVSVDAWLDVVTERALSRELTAEPPAPIPVALVLSQPEFADAVRQALRDWHRPDLLARNPLLGTRLLRDRASSVEPDAAALDALLRAALDALAAHPRDDKLLRAVDRTYLRPAATQESAAAMLGLPFSTYRRHLTQGVARVVGWLWEREVYGPTSPTGQ